MNTVKTLTYTTTWKKRKFDTNYQNSEAYAKSFAKHVLDDRSY